MEATRANVSNTFANHFTNQFVEASGVGAPTVASRFHFTVAPFESNKSNNFGNKNMQHSFTRHVAGSNPMVHVPPSTPGVSNCYIFKSRLQEYAQKVGLQTPVYETIKEGPSHEPSFRSTVIVNGVRYDSLPGFFNRKAAEQSAAEIALMELSKCGDKKEAISVPVHETGLCKNLLQEYAQKMNYAIPSYICRKDDTPGRTPLFSCTVEIGGVQYIGASAKTKKEAEVKAARTALLEIRLRTSAAGQSQYTVVPCKRKVSETAPPTVEAANKKPKKSRFRKKPPKRKHSSDVVEQIQAANMGVMANINTGAEEVAGKQFQSCVSDGQVPDSMQNPLCLPNSAPENKSSNTNRPSQEVSTGDSGLVAEVSVNNDPCQLPCQQLCEGSTGPAEFSGSLTDGNSGSAVGIASTMITDPPASGKLDGISDSEAAQGDSAPSVADTNHATTELSHTVANGA